MSYYYPGTNCIDHTNRLGFAKMPEGYVLLQLDSGHFMWHHPESDDDSCITWDKWACYHGAKEDLKHRKIRAAFEQTKKREHSEHAAILRDNP